MDTGMTRKELFVFGGIIAGLLIASTGLLYVSLGSNPVEASTPTANTTTPATPTETPQSQSDAVQDGLRSTDYDAAKETLLVKTTATSSEWELTLYRNDTHLMTLVPEEHVDANGNTHATTARWQQNTSVSENKSFALIGSSVIAGNTTEETTDDVYNVSMLLPNVENETIRIEYVDTQTGETEILLDEAY